MAPRSRGAQRALESFTTSSSSRPHICSSCRQSLSKRSYASAATAQASVESPPITQLSPDHPQAIPSTQTQSAHTIKAGILLSRPPLLTPPPHPFETAHQLYQRRLNERLALPFTQYFYYRRATPTFEHWRKHRRARNGVATRDVGNYNAYGEDSWNDEVLVGDETGKPERLLERLIEEEGRQDEYTGGGEKRFAGLRRRTKADTTGDLRSLERRLERTLYLMVKTKARKGEKEGSWTFPEGAVVGFEGLKEAAQRILATSLGPNMNTFFVGNHPVGHHITQFSSPQESIAQLYNPKRPSTSDAPSLNPTVATDPQTPQDHAATQTELVSGSKTFFMKARIMAGQASLPSPNLNNENPPAGVQKSSPRDAKGVLVDLGLDTVEDFVWLSKDEVEERVGPAYWKGIRNMLVSQ